MSRKPKRFPLILSSDDIKKILIAILSRSRNGGVHEFIEMRDATMVWLAYNLGLRPKETRLIKMDDLNLEKQELYIPAENNKQRQQDVMPIPDFLFKSICKYLSLRNRYFYGSQWLFPREGITNEDLPVNRSTHSCMFRKALIKAELYKVAYKDAGNLKRANFNLYSLRHSFASRVYDRTNHDIKKTALCLRHYDWQFRTTMRYIHTTNGTTRKGLMEELFNIPEKPKELEV